MKIAILGSKGTIGSVIYNELKHLHTTIPFDRKICDLRNFDELGYIFKNQKFDAVINCSIVGGGNSIGEFNSEHFKENLTIFKNLKNLSDTYGVLINIGSGAEYDITQNIKNVSELDILNIFPYDSYGLVKNLISRECLNIPNAITLRIFGCFDPSEPSFRLLRKFIDYNYYGTIVSSFILDEFELKNDRLFSWISAIDLADIVNQAIHNRHDIPKDINCAYPDPIKLSEMLNIWCNIHNKNYRYKIANNYNFEYTCNTNLLQSFFTIKNGLENSLKVYT